MTLIDCPTAWCHCPLASGKVVDRHWYNKNKHIYPASRWAPFDDARQFKGEQAEGEGDGTDK